MDLRGLMAAAGSRWHTTAQMDRRFVNEIVKTGLSVARPMEGPDLAKSPFVDVRQHFADGASFDLDAE